MPILGVEQPEVVQIDGNLRLRKFDAIIPEALEWYQDTETVYLVDGVKAPYTSEKLERMYRYLDKQGELYYIEVLDGGVYRPIGDVTFWQEDMPIVIGNGRYRGRGLGRKVISALADRGRALGFEKIYVHEIYRYNTGSRRCFESAGFRVCEEREDSVRLLMELT